MFGGDVTASAVLASAPPFPPAPTPVVPLDEDEAAAAATAAAFETLDRFLVGGCGGVAVI